MTTITNPIEAVINNITGLKGFDFGAGNLADLQAKLGQLDYLYTPGGVKPATPRAAPTGPDAAALALFKTLARSVYDIAPNIFKKQLAWQGKYKDDLDSINNYLLKDFRGKAWTMFDPDNAKELANAKLHSQLLHGYSTP